MSSLRGFTPLIYRRIGRTDLAKVALIELDEDQVARFLDPLPVILEAVRRGPAHSLIGVEVSGNLIGFYVVHPDRRDASCWWLGWLAIGRAHQGFGHGRAIVEAVLVRLGRIPGCRRIRLLVAPANFGARRLYARSGFHFVGEIRGELVLERDLKTGPTREMTTPWTLGSSFAQRDPSHLRLRACTGPHAARVIGVERGPPDAVSTPCASSG